ncbi:tRNA lysidine(34) synthetase TilS [Pseudomonas chlororaphis]|uniref:tRNA lysidine(34) synthetase TilS n=1 Tax=Pseudomonas chlororaphis TaxID=587753 RepID=UPI003857E83D
MSPFDTVLTQKLLQRLLPWLDRSAWRIAFSGGLDSTVLLHLLAQLRQRHRLPPLTAIHVHHGLQAAADAWPEHCRTQCEALGVPLQIVAVQVQPGASLERAAREARYAAFEEAAGGNELLLTAQHRDDQAETLLFRLLRGAGVRGLSAMPASRALGQGHLLRPLLDVSRDELERYARDHQLHWIDDPSNQDRQFSRNYLRHQVFPLLTARWPQAASSMARSAAHLREARELLDELAIIDLRAAALGVEFEWLGLPSLALAPLVGLSEARQRNALSHWLSKLRHCPTATTGRAGRRCAMLQATAVRYGGWGRASCSGRQGASGGCRIAGCNPCCLHRVGSIPLRLCCCRAMVNCNSSVARRKGPCRCVTVRGARSCNCPDAATATSSACSTRRVCQPSSVADCRCCIEAKNCSRWRTCQVLTQIPMKAGNCIGSRLRAIKV